MKKFTDYPIISPSDKREEIHRNTLRFMLDSRENPLHVEPLRVHFEQIEAFKHLWESNYPITVDEIV